MATINRQRGKLFLDQHENEPRLRSLTFDEAAWTSFMVSMLMGNLRLGPRNVFTVGDLVAHVGVVRELPHPEIYMYAAHDFLQRLVAARLLVEVPTQPTSEPTGITNRAYHASREQTTDEWAIG